MAGNVYQPVFSPENGEHMGNTILAWDSAVPLSGRRYINAADLLIGRDAANGMRAVGFAEAESDADYDRFRKFLSAVPFMEGHRSVTAASVILDTVCGMKLTDDPDEIWEECGLALSRSRVDRPGLASLLGFRDIFARVCPGEAVPEQDNIRIRIHPVYDLGRVDGCLFASGSVDVFSEYTDRDLADLHGKGGRAVRITLGNYSFDRNSRKREVDCIAKSLADGNAVTAGERNQLLTAVMISLAAAAKKHGMRLVIETDNITALYELYDYLGMNGIIPESVIVTRYSDELAGFIGKFGFSTDSGKPGIAAALHDPLAAAEAIPLGCVLVRTDSAVDIQGLAALPQFDRFPASCAAALRIFL